jgi:hypothetical protein
VTDELLDRLAADTRPVRRGGTPRRLALGLALGGPAAVFGVLLVLGPRRDLTEAVGTATFWFKLAYAGALAAIALAALEQAARPAGRPAPRLVWLAAPAVFIVALALWQIAAAAPADRRALVMGDSAAICPWLIAAASAPLFAALMWAMRGLAPTRLRLAGALTGLAAGALAAGAYCLHCAESGAPFVALWYTLGMLAPSALGALAGPRLLRW